MRHLVLFLFVLGCGACSGDTKLTWGDVSQDLAEGYCEALDACGFVSDTPVCIEHTAWHLCEPEHSCDTDLPDAARSALEACLEALPEASCTFLWYGQLPIECGDILEMRPE